MRAAAGVNGGHSDRTGSANNPRSDVGNPTRVAADHPSHAFGSHMRQMTMSLTGGRDAHRGEWRRPHPYRSRRQRVGVALWWLAVAAAVTAGVVYIVKQS